MRYSDAVRLYFKKNHQSAGVLKKIMRWDARLTILQNSKRIKIKVTPTRNFAEKFGLKFHGYGPRRGPPPDKKIKRKGVEKLRKLGYTLDQIGRLHQVSRQRIEQLLRRWRNKK